ncbi:MAG: outer membrane lipoprotein-sorting protein [Candidatus Margulisbacteria bacterium]|jgi:outer membrane lipoprotein-sorting protein|nr:outer membrane lipoprotein-sorting protein [Candidatus Margulisiibacteriota bacterium]
MKRDWLALILLGGLGMGAWGITGEQIIRQVDSNMTFTTARSESRMVIHVDQEVREKTMRSYSRGQEASYSEFLTPARDQGVKYLKIKDNMWMYLPSVDKIIKISGAMLRQSMMGSDFSYEDALESTRLLEKYAATLAGEETLGGRVCYIIDLTAKVKEVTYFKRRVWIDKERFIPLREELFALSGKKLKEMTLGEVKRFGRRYYPTYLTMRNLLRANSRTELFTTRIEFDIAVDPKVFTQGNLTK